jgi:predicted nuclease of predicted toxin-antitoxin system
MSHWNRSPRAISVKALLIRSKLRFIFDHGLPVELATCLPEGAYAVHPTGLAQQASREEVAELCQRKHGILVTANSEYASLLSLDAKAPSGVILLPEKEPNQLDIFRRLFAETLVFRPAVERMAMIEHAGRNRLLLDMRQGQPVMSIFCSCRWLL